jgi:isoquinoline 1-oxidoreductase beta subunit
MQRRNFLILATQSLSAGALWTLAAARASATSSASASTPAETGASAAPLAPWQPFAWLEFHADGRIVTFVHRSEMGQGVLTALPMLIAEELGVDLAQVEARLAPGALAFRDAQGNQTTGYSSSVSSSFLPLRQMGATARVMLLAAAAARLDVAMADLQLGGGVVVHSVSQRSVPWGELLPQLRTMAIPAQVVLKPRADFRLLGRDLPRLDTANKTDGSAQYGIDVRVPNMWVGVIARCPVPGARVASLDSRAARALRGVRQVVALGSGVAVLAEDFFSARRGRDALEIRWESAGKGDDASHRRQLDAALAQPGITARATGRFAGGNGGNTTANGVADATASHGGKRIAAAYFTPFLAHAALEPLACTAHVQKDRCDIWLGTQAPSRAQNWGAQLTGLPLERVFVHTHTIGGAFGRRGEWDFVIEAVEASKAAGRPVKIIWTREDDMRHDFYRPATANKLLGAVDDAGRLVEYQHDIAAPSIARRRSPDMLKTGSDFLLTQGSGDLHYDVPHIRVAYREVDLGVPVGFWRSVGHSHNGFVAECFVDELAYLAKRDPLQFRLDLLQSEPRMHGVLERAARAAGWERGAQGKGIGLGVAVMKAYGTYVAEVARVEVKANEWRVTDVYCAVDCGLVVNPGIVRQQMQGGIVYGLSAALSGRISLRDGAVEQSNFHDYPVLRMHECPRIEVEIVSSEAAPGGCGEPSTPVIAPAVANAIFAATGRRLRSLPLTLGS